VIDVDDLIGGDDGADDFAWLHELAGNFTSNRREQLCSRLRRSRCAVRLRRTPPGVRRLFVLRTRSCQRLQILLTRGFGVAGAAIARCRCFIRRWAATTPCA
jgi:hypothetical protein